MFAHLKQKLAPLRRKMGDQFATGSYLEETPDSWVNQARREVSNKQKVGTFHLAAHSSAIHAGLGVRNLIQIGSGGFGSVYACQNECDGQSVVVKVIAAPYLTKYRNKIWKRVVRREIKHLKMLSHDNIVKVYDFMWLRNSDNVKTHVAIKMEHLQISLYELLQDIKRPLTENEMVHLASQLAPALDYMHSYKMVHHDIKPANIMIDKIDLVDRSRIHEQLLTCQYKIIDLGLARIYPKHRDNCNREVRHRGGTDLYLSPEKKNKKTMFNPYLADSFAFGATLLYVLLGSNQFHARYYHNGESHWKAARQYFLEMDQNNARNPLQTRYQSAILDLLAETDQKRVQMDKALEFFK